MWKFAVIAWALAGFTCWAVYDAKNFSRLPVGTLTWLAIDVMAGPLMWLRLLLPQM